MIRQFIANWSSRRIRQDLDELLRFLRSGTASEMSTALATSMVARSFLEESSQLPCRFQFDLLDNERIVELADRPLIHQNILATGRLIASVKKTWPDDVSGDLIGSGFIVWKSSLHALLNADRFSRCREIWSELMRGQPGYQTSIDELVSANLLNASVCNMITLRPPRLLVPEFRYP